MGGGRMTKHLRQVKPVIDAGRDRESVLVAEKPSEPMKRLTIDVPLSLHTRLKTACAASEKKIADVVRDLIENHIADK
jgi:hypothetical protein